VTYLERKAQNDANELEKNQTIFGLMAGAILMLVGFLAWLAVTPSIWSVLLLCAIGLGAVLFLLSVAAPALLKYPYKGFRAWGNFMGKVIFTLVLAVVYVLFVFPVGLMLRRKAQAPSPSSQFRPISQENIPSAAKSSYFGVMQKLLSLFMLSKQYMMIPVLILLALLGLLFFFVTSNVVLAFVYTIF